MGLEIIPLRSQAWVFFSDEDNTVQCFCKGLLSGKFISPLCSGPGLHATSELPNHWDVAHRCTPKVKVKSLSRVRFFATPWTVAYQVPPSMGFSRQECWSGLPFPSPGDLPNQGSNLGLPHCRQTLYRLSHQGSLVCCKLLLSCCFQDSETSAFDSNYVSQYGSLIFSYWELFSFLDV